MIILDTHVWFWWINLEHQHFSSGCRKRIEHSDRVGVSPGSCCELALAHQRGRIELPASPSQWFTEALGPAGIELIPISAQIAARAVTLTDIHRDPFDRLIVATALEYGAELASRDGLIGRYPELAGRIIQ